MYHSYHSTYIVLKIANFIHNKETDFSTYLVPILVEEKLILILTTTFCMKYDKPFQFFVHLGSLSMRKVEYVFFSFCGTAREVGK